MADETLTDREETFCRWCESGMTAKQAAEAAGYTKKGYEKQLLQKEKIQKRLQHSMRQQTQENKIAPREEILAFLTETMRGGEEEADIKTRMRAAELLGRRNGVFTTEGETQCRVIIVDDIGKEKAAT